MRYREIVEKWEEKRKVEKKRTPTSTKTWNEHHNDYSYSLTMQLHKNWIFKVRILDEYYWCLFIRIRVSFLLWPHDNQRKKRATIKKTTTTTVSIGMCICCNVVIVCHHIQKHTKFGYIHLKSTISSSFSFLWSLTHWFVIYIQYIHPYTQSSHVIAIHTVSSYTFGIQSNVDLKIPW